MKNTNLNRYEQSVFYDAIVFFSGIFESDYLECYNAIKNSKCYYKCFRNCMDVEMNTALVNLCRVPYLFCHLTVILFQRTATSEFLHTSDSMQLSKILNSSFDCHNAVFNAFITALCLSIIRVVALNTSFCPLLDSAAEN